MNRHIFDVTLVHEFGDELALLPSRRFALKKSRHSFRKSPRGEQRRNDEGGQQTRHLHPQRYRRDKRYLTKSMSHEARSERASGVKLPWVTADETGNQAFVRSNKRTSHSVQC